MPPPCPPIPSAQVLQAFFERMALKSFHGPPASRAFCQVYEMAAQPPPLRTFFMATSNGIDFAGDIGTRQRQS